MSILLPYMGKAKININIVTLTIKMGWWVETYDGQIDRQMDGQMNEGNNELLDVDEEGVDG